MVRGWVYVILNAAMPELVKIGYSLKDPVIRARELNHTGSPHPYIVAYDALVNNPRELEKKLHRLLEHAKEGKEWFRLSDVEAVRAIRAANSEIILEHIPLAGLVQRLAGKPEEPSHQETCDFKGCASARVHRLKDGFYCRWHFRELRRPDKAAAIRLLREEQERS